MRSALYGALSMLVPFLGLLSLSMGIVALGRVNAGAWPPVAGPRPRDHRHRALVPEPDAVGTGHQAHAAALDMVSEVIRLVPS